MSRQLRIEYPGATYHVMARGNNRERIVHDERDVEVFLQCLAETCERYEWRVFGWCVMPNHYHLVLTTARETLSHGMRRHNSTYAQFFNQRHSRVGHVFQGRYKAFVVAKERYLLAVLRYVELNPVRAALVQDPLDWPWSSVHVSLGRAPTPAWSATGEVWTHFGSAEADGIRHYREFLLGAVKTADAGFPVQQSLVIGDDDFAADVRSRARHVRLSSEIPAEQRRARPSLPALFFGRRDMDAAIKDAYLAGFTLRAIAGHLGVHPSTVSAIARRRTPRKRGSSVALRAAKD